MLLKKCNAEDSTGCVILIIVMIISLVFGFMLGYVGGISHERSQIILNNTGYYTYPEGKPVFIYGVKK